ncbi:hypothetical protein QTH25_12955 [Clostridium perfringens]|uniref:hypothetical protein n=1 Tax=Clostridium perfringens TaxID=1502 RepID=UPI00338E2A4C|nr:hypothetical protein [Clostridium perfringens]
MSTPFGEITRLILMGKEKSKFGYMNADMAYELLSDLIITGATVDFYQCKKDLNKFTKYSEIRNSFSISGNQNELRVKKSENIKENIFILNINGFEVSEFDYEVLDNEIVITYDFKDGDEVEVVQCFEGEFEEDLNHREKYIVALSAYMHYINQIINDEDKLRTQIGDKDYSRTSNANMLKTVISLKETLENKLDKYINQYVYSNMTSDDLM